MTRTGGGKVNEKKVRAELKAKGPEGGGEGVDFSTTSR